jgi:hypothetical protein
MYVYIDRGLFVGTYEGKYVTSGFLYKYAYRKNSDFNVVA